MKRIANDLVTLDTWTVWVNGRDIATVDLRDRQVHELAATLRRGDPAADVELVLTAHERGILLALLADRPFAARRTRVSAW